MKDEHGLDRPRRLQVEFSRTVQLVTEESGTEISPAEMWDRFAEEYLEADARVKLLAHEVTTGDEEATITAQLLVDGDHRTAVGRGSGPIDAFVHALGEELGIAIDVVDYSEHAVSSGSDATAVAYVESLVPDGTIKWGVGLHPSILTASLRAVVSAVNRQRLGSGATPE